MKAFEIFERFVGVLKNIPSDIHALNLVLVGVVLILRGHATEGQSVIVAGLTLLKGHQPQP